MTSGYSGSSTDPASMPVDARGPLAYQSGQADLLSVLDSERSLLQLRLAQEGYNVRVYIPYGLRWYPYFMRRLAERPANIFFIIRNLIKG